jgi:hypothetical protein
MGPDGVGRELLDDRLAIFDLSERFVAVAEADDRHAATGVDQRAERSADGQHRIVAMSCKYKDALHDGSKNPAGL